MTNEVKCKHYDEENGWCKKLSDWIDPMPHIVYCPKSPCEYAEPIEQPMNDNDIIKAYEGLTPHQQLNLFRNLYYNDGCATERGVIANAINDIFSEYNRQKAEIEALKLINSTYCAETKRIRDIAFREFAEKLKGIDLYQCIEEYYKNAELCYEVRQDWFCEQIDNLVKEMTEGEDDTD